MIYYFSGTGNSAKVAKELGKNLNEEVISVSQHTKRLSLNKDEMIGLVFPIHAWGPALPIVSFIMNLGPDFIGEICNRKCPVWIVMTCGDETGNAPHIVDCLLQSKGLRAAGMWSVVMPNTYVLLPGFDVDSKDVENAKLSGLSDRIQYISKKISDKNWERDLVYGSMPRLKTRLVYPLFKRWGIFPKKWNVSGNCTGCGLCSSICPENNIIISDGKPLWKNNCVSCLGCYHCCPAKAINYGKITRFKGHYNTLISSLISFKRKS